MKFGAIIAAAGSSSRMGNNRAKVLEMLSGKTCIRWIYEEFDKSEYIDAVTVVCREEDRELLEKETCGLSVKFYFTHGGNTRQKSVENGLKAMPECSYVVIQDGARPLTTKSLIDRVCADALKHGASAPAVPAKDTYKLADSQGFILDTPDRSSLMAVQTPQVFAYDMYVKALQSSEGGEVTDDCRIVENYGHPVHLVLGDYKNIKLTTPEDICIAKAFLAERKEMKNMLRIGQGYDVHILAENRKLILCGVEIPYEKGLLGHSDADAAVHALCDAILGAAALGDIGKWFPDTDDEFLGADSMELLRQVLGKVQERGYVLCNADITIAAQRPRLAPYIDEMRKKTAAACGADIGQISIKATTEEGLGVSGEGKGISAYAVCLLQKSE